MLDRIPNAKNLISACDQVSLEESEKQQTLTCRSAFKSGLVTGTSKQLGKVFQIYILKVGSEGENDMPLGYSTLLRFIAKCYIHNYIN
jgi:hypothetical protein